MIIKYMTRLAPLGYHYILSEAYSTKLKLQT
jgi:hypothetical protein